MSKPHSLDIHIEQGDKYFTIRSICPSCGQEYVRQSSLHYTYPFVEVALECEKCLSQGKEWYNTPSHRKIH